MAIFAKILAQKIGLQTRIVQLQIFPKLSHSREKAIEAEWPVLRSRDKFLLAVLCFVVPLGFYSSYLRETKVSYHAIGNDFMACYYLYKAYLVSFLAQSHFPLWSPAEGAGFPFYSSPLAQAFYPLNWLLVLFDKYYGGFTPFDYQVFTVYGVAIYSLGSFLWLSSLSKNLRAVVFATLVMSCSYQFGEILRFPNAVHTAAWYSWILWSLTEIFKTAGTKKAWIHGGLLMAWTIFLLTASYPYYIFYSVFLFFPYILFLISPRIRSRYLELNVAKPAQGLMISASFASLGALICSPYLLRISQLLKQTMHRAGNVYSFSIFGSSSPLETLGNFLYPPLASMEGWFYFGILGVLILGLYFLGDLASSLAGSSSSSSDLEKEISRKELTFKLFWLNWFLMICLITYGDRSLLFHWLWKFMPMFSSMRLWSRLNILFVPVLSLLLTVAYAHFEKLLEQPKPRKWVYVLLGLSLAGIIFGLQAHWLLNHQVGAYWRQYSAGRAKDYFTFGWQASLPLLAILVAALFLRFKPYLLCLVALLMTCLSIRELAPYGTSIWSYVENYTPRKRVDVIKYDWLSFKTVRFIDRDSLSLSPAFYLAPMANWHYARYGNFLEQSNAEKAEQQQILGVKDAQKIFLSKKIDYPKLKDFLADSQQFQGSYHVHFYNGDRLEVNISLAKPGYLSFIDNWDADWRAQLDGKPVPIELLMGTFKSVLAPAGAHKITFSYEPAWFKYLNARGT